MIPQIIHQVWEGKTEPLPVFLSELGKTWTEHNPEWRYEFWNYERMESFVLQYYPDFIDIYHGFRYDVQRWDVIRYMILYQMGGLYVDFDYECIESIDKYVVGKTCCFGVEPEEHAILFNKKYIISNAFMLSIPRHPFIQRLLETVRNTNSLSDDKLVYVLETTGPYMLSGVYENYEYKNEIDLFTAEMVSPLTKGEIARYIGGYVEGKDLDKKIQKAIAIHYYFGTWLR